MFKLNYNNISTNCVYTYKMHWHNNISIKIDT